ncbi:MAG: hypothetical protein WDZ91_15720 [Paenibacillaceae bacterium]
MLSRFLTYYRPHWKLFAIDFGCALILALLELAFPLAAKWIVDSLIPEGRWIQSFGLVLVSLHSTY